MQCTVRAAAASLYFPYVLYVHLHRLRAPPASGELPDPLGSPQLGFPLADDDDERGPSIARLIVRLALSTDSG